MKKILISLIVLFLFLLPGFSVIAETIEKGYIAVTESTTKEISPNQAEISISIETSNKSLQTASEENKKIANKVYESLKNLLNPNDYIKTSNYSARAEYIYTNNKKNIDKYVVSNTITIRVKKVELVSKLIDTAIAQGATNIENLQFSATDYDCSCNDALAELTKKAYNKAEFVAKSINSQIIGLKSINATCNLENNPYPMGGMLARQSKMDNFTTPIESGKLKIYANVDASFYTK